MPTRSKVPSTHTCSGRTCYIYKNTDTEDKSARRNLSLRKQPRTKLNHLGSHPQENYSRSPELFESSPKRTGHPGTWARVWV